jgi:hypothetical protein
VQVEVVAGQVGEERAREARPGDAPERDAMRGDLHNDPADAPLAHPGEHLLHLDGLGGGADRGAALGAGDRLHGRHEAAPLLAVGAGEDGVERVGRGRLAVGAGDPVDLHARRRVAEDGARERGEGGPGVRHDGCRRVRNLALRDDEGGAPAQGLGDELGPVALEAGDRDEGEARLNAPRVVGDAPHPSLRALRDLSAENPRQLCPVQDHSP